MSQNVFPKSFYRQPWLLVGVIVLVVSLLIVGWFWYASRDIRDYSAPTTLVVTVDGLEKNTPLFLEDAEGQRQVIPNGQEVEVESGSYTVRTQVDGVGSLQEGVEVAPNQPNTFDLELDTDRMPDDSGQATAPALANLPSQAIEGLFGEPNEQNLESGNSVAFLDRPVGSVVLPPDFWTASASNPSKDKPVNQEPDSNSESETSPNSNSQPQSEPQFSEPSQAPRPQPTVYVAPRQSEAQPSFENDLILDTGQDEVEPITIAQDCQIYRVDFEASGTRLRYFKTCPDTGQNGFYAYNLQTGQEKRLLVTSEVVNMIRTDIDPNSDKMVFTKATGEFGLIQDGKVEILLPDVYYSAPQFSPDGQYVVVLDNRPSGQKSPSPGEAANLYEAFGLKILVARWSDILENKGQAKFKEVGQTYYIPRPDDYTFEFWGWLDNDRLRMGDSPKIFSLQAGAVGFADDPGQEPGRIYLGGDGRQYRIHQGIVYDENGSRLLTGVSQVFQLQENIYFVIDSRLFRVRDGLPVQAYPTRLLSIQAIQNQLILINPQGEVLVYTVNSE